MILRKMYNFICSGNQIYLSVVSTCSATSGKTGSSASYSKCRFIRDDQPNKRYISKTLKNPFCGQNNGIFGGHFGRSRGNFEGRSDYCPNKQE